MAPPHQQWQSREAAHRGSFRFAFTVPQSVEAGVGRHPIKETGGKLVRESFARLEKFDEEDGHIYNYLQIDRGQDVFLGKDSHFAEVAVTARLLPGNYLVVSSVKKIAQ